jgi:hypothetical protein
MITTSRIASGFDVELQLGGRWFLTAINLLNDHGLLAPGIPIIVTDVRVTFEPDGDLEIDVVGLADPVFARVTLSDDGTELTITTNVPTVPDIVVPFGALKDLAEPPVLVKLEGDVDHEPVMAVLANLDIHAEIQSDEPLPDSEFVARGNADNALSFLPIGKHVAFGMGRETYSRFANNIWHTNLRADDGSHPLPDEENKRGTWSRVSMSASGGTMRLKLEGDIPVDSPIIDVVPDPHVTITLSIAPVVSDGKLSFRIEPDTDVDTGLLGDLLGGVVGGIVGFIVGLLTGGILVAVLVGAVVGIIVVEVAEVVVEGIVQKEIKATIDGEPVADIHCCEEGIVQIAKPGSDSFNLSVLDAIPSSIVIHTENPANEPLYKRSLLVTSIYDDVTANLDGFAAAGTTGTDERFQPEEVTLVAATYSGDQLTSLTYRRGDGQQQMLTLGEVQTRATEGELEAPFKLFTAPEDATLRIPEAKLACVCLKPVAIRRKDTIVEEIEFENGLRLLAPDSIALQDAAALVVMGYQLIHPRDYHAYYRAKADFFKDNNFESLPEFAA